MPGSKQCKMSLGSELSLRASSLYAYGTMTAGRNAAVKHGLRTERGSRSRYAGNGYKSEFFFLESFLTFLVPGFIMGKLFVL